MWDLVKYKFLKVIQDMHTTDITNAKIYHMSDSETLFAVSAEDSGAVCHIEFGRKGIFGGFTQNTQYLFKTRLKGTSTISCQRK